MLFLIEYRSINISPLEGGSVVRLVQFGRSTNMEGGRSWKGSQGGGEKRWELAEQVEGWMGGSWEDGIRQKWQVVISVLFFVTGPNCNLTASDCYVVQWRMPRGSHLSPCPMLVIQSGFFFRIQKYLFKFTPNLQYNVTSDYNIWIEWREDPQAPPNRGFTFNHPTATPHIRQTFDCPLQPIH